MLLAICTLTLNFAVLLLAAIYFIAHLLYWSYFDPLLSYIFSSNFLEGIYFLNPGISKNISVLPSTWIQIRLVSEQLFLLAQQPFLPVRNHLSLILHSDGLSGDDSIPRPQVKQIYDKESMAIPWPYDWYNNGRWPMPGQREWILLALLQKQSPRAANGQLGHHVDEKEANNCTERGWQETNSWVLGPARKWM